MKRLIIVCLALFSGKAFSQDYPKNQINLNALNAIAIASVELGYERYVDFNQSIEVEMFFNDRFSYFPKGDNRKYSATSIKVGYNYYFDLDNLSGPYINPFIKQRFGSFKETVLNADKKEVVETTKLDSFIFGIGIGYIWNYNDTFVVAPYVNIGRNFGKKIVENKYFWAIEPNAGIKIGYKF
ncbi:MULTISPECIES: hypothetical protein [Capnocytophaga]|uniref:DUF3575 domain-containing protein n=1 Tax=Capnocytophaga canis TaxID=1848903 RepID=A0A0B7I6F9_9FLAO|nr:MULTISPECIES: hypothetical protein [Capnocytophaga]ATA73817.1 DUF3575 domain-containing protein [Capnocytophaga sp. H4358]ATA75965.1 DUF3575 domain-containing protein [Capnocytophaga sp. H2931]RIY37794.1 DUF3575 domain-containing protein [Capnocytophaga canis]CEN45849.1 Secreted protein [Capnocytophaga canis]CEN47280.1 Secreted protein [Capnocytophaga canis]